MIIDNTYKVNFKQIDRGHEFSTMLPNSDIYITKSPLLKKNLINTEKNYAE